MENLPEPDLLIENSQIIIRRPKIIELILNAGKPKPDTPKVKKILTEDEKRERAMRLKQIEFERKKALKAAARRAKLNKLSALEEEKLEEQVNIIKK